MPQANLNGPPVPLTSFLVVDTNFLLETTGLDIIKQLVALHKTWGHVVVIPKEVLRELDGLKNRSSLQRNARLASATIANYFSVLDPGLRGQQIREGYSKEIRNDESIIDCALYYKDKYHHPVIMISNDTNLRISCLTEGIPTVRQTTSLKADDIALNSWYEAKSLAEARLHSEANPQSGTVSASSSTIVDDDADMMDWIGNDDSQLAADTSLDRYTEDSVGDISLTELSEIETPAKSSSKSTTGKPRTLADSKYSSAAPKNTGSSRTPLHFSLADLDAFVSSSAKPEANFFDRDMSSAVLENTSVSVAQPLKTPRKKGKFSLAELESALEDHVIEPKQSASKLDSSASKPVATTSSSIQYASRKTTKLSDSKWADLGVKPQQAAEKTNNGGASLAASTSQLKQKYQKPGNLYYWFLHELTISVDQRMRTFYKSESLLSKLGYEGKSLLSLEDILKVIKEFPSAFPPAMVGKDEKRRFEEAIARYNVTLDDEELFRDASFFWYVLAPPDKKDAIKEQIKIMSRIISGDVSVSPMKPEQITVPIVPVESRRLARHRRRERYDNVMQDKLK